MGILNQQIIQSYLESLKRGVVSGNYTEHSYRPFLKTLLESVEESITAINEPTRIGAGAPDFLITNNNRPIGYIETKPIGSKLDDIVESKQIKRYLQGISNLILTNYTEFHWYVSGKLVLTLHLATIAKNGELITDNTGDFSAFVKRYLGESTHITNPKDLAIHMATYASLIRNELIELLKGTSSKTTYLRQQLEGFRAVLLDELTENELADMYAQTICYGLFAARCVLPKNEKLKRQDASYIIPKTNPFLRRMFNLIVGPDLNDNIVWMVEDLISLLNSTDINKVLFSSNGYQDRIIHFYETFLSQYNKSLKTLRGVFFTPEPIVTFMVKSVNGIIKRKFGIPGGLADSSLIKTYKSKHLHKVQILDPATGTGTFLNGIIKEIYKSFEKNKGLWPAYVYKHLLPRLFGFELLMAPYTVSHLNISLELQRLGYDLSLEERLRVYLTNTLEEAHEMVKEPPFSQWLAEEANAARAVKSEVPVMVVIGNPPYQGTSANNNDWIKYLIRDYYYVDNEPLNERNTKWLLDDYVKFIRFGQWRIEQTGTGILAYITNHAFLDNATFRGMRRSLMKSFDEIYILNLHGNSRKHEKSPDGGVDENVFDIEQGVSITFLIKYNHKNNKRTKIYYSDLWGKREKKYNFLSKNDIYCIKWKEINPIKPFYLFVPLDVESYEEYKLGWKITDIFRIYSNGIVTARDNFTINWSPEDVKQKIEDFVKLDPESARSKYKLRADVQDWKVHTAQKDILNSGVKAKLIKPILYRPFDIRYTYYSGNSSGFICRPRKSVMSNLLNGKNVSLITSRLTKGENFRHAIVSQNISDAAFLSSKTSNNAFTFPLYIIDNDETDPLIDDLKPHHNFTQPFLDFIMKHFLKSFKHKNVEGKVNITPLEILGYIYSILYSNQYRERFRGFLSIDFPRIPFTTDSTLFFRLSDIGKSLINLHLENDINTFTNFPIAGTNKVTNIKYTLVNGKIWRVYINNKQYFENIPEDIWNYHIGGYKVCEKWLKSRKGRVLSYDELVLFQKIVSIIGETIKIQECIDNEIENHGGWPII